MEHFGISECMGGGKISMPPMVGVRIFSGTTHSSKPTCNIITYDVMKDLRS